MANWQESGKKILDNRKKNTNNTSSATSAQAVVSAPKVIDAPKNTDTWQGKAQQILNKRGYVPPENRMYTLKTNDGQDFGTVSYDAYKAIVRNNLDNYTPKTEEEEASLDSFKAYAQERYDKQKEAEKQKRINSNPATARYNIDPDNFTKVDFEKWAEEHGFEYRMGGNDLTGVEMKWLPKEDTNAPWYHFGFSVIPTKQEQEDKKILETLAENNQRRENAQKDIGGANAAIYSFIDGLTFGAIPAAADWLAERDYKKAGLDPDDFVSGKTAIARTQAEHPYASAGGDIVGSVISLGGVSKAVGTATKGIKWLSSAPKWVQSAVNSGITFSAIGSTETAFDGGNAEEILRSAGINLVGGAVGGSLSSVVGSIGEKFLFSKDLQHKVIPEIIRNGLSSAAYAGGNTLATSFLYPEGYKPTAEEVARDLATAFAFGSISSAINITKTSAQNKKFLESLNSKMAADYEQMARANISNKSDIAGIHKFAKNVVGYSNAMEAYLTGKEYSATINGETYTFTPNKVRLVGQDKYVKSVLNDLQTIRSNAKAVLNGVGTPTTDLATTPGTTPGATASVPPVSSAPSSVPATKEAVAPINVAEIPQSVPPVVNTPVVAETTPINSNTNDFTDELSEVASAGDVPKYAPESASADVVSLENKLIDVGASDVERQKVVETAIDVENTLIGTVKSLKDVLADATRITGSAVTAFEHNVGAPKNYWSIFNTNLKAIATLQTKESFIADYANTFAEILQNTDSVISKAVTDSKIDVASAVSQHALTGSVPGEVKNETVLSVLSKAFTAITEPVLSQINTAHISIYGDARTQEPTPIDPAETQTAQADNLVTNEQFEKIESSGTLSPEDAQKYNIVVSNLKKTAEELGLLDNSFFTALQNVNLYNPSASDRALISAEFRRVFAGNTDPLITGWLDAIGVEAQPVTSKNEKNMPVSTENTPVSEDATNIDVDMADGKILSLKHTKNVYSLFKGAVRVVVGKDVITDGFVAISLTDEALAEVKKVAGDVIQDNPNLELSKIYHKDNDVLIQGNPKTDEISAKKKVEKAYVFKIDNAFYTCQQKYIDAFNNGKNVITANKRVRVPWTVHNENGEFVALFLGADYAMNDERFNSLQSVSEIKTAEKQKKAENANKPFNQNEVRWIIEGGRPFFSTVHGVNYVGEGHIFVACDENTAEFIKSEYRKQNANSNYEIEQNEGFGGTVEKMLSEAKELAEAKDPISYSGASPNNRADNAYIIGDYAIVFNKNYANIIKKRSKDMKIISNGSISRTILVGYDADGNITGFALPIFAKGNVTTKDGKSVPFVGEADIKRLVREASTNETKSDKSVIETPESVKIPEKTEENTSVSEEKTEYKHLYNEETVSEEFINSVNPEIESAILNIRNGNTETVPDVVEVTELTEDTIKKISDFVGFDVSGYTCKIEKDALQHIENRHGINGSHDHSLSDPKDTARMGYIVNNSDSVDWIREKDGTVKTSKKYRDKNNKPAKLVMVQKKIDGTYCVSDVVPDSKNKTIWVTSARIQKKHQDLDDNNVSPKTTPENALNASNTIIAEEAENVNTSEETTTPTLTNKCEMHETTHTKTGETLWVISLNDKITSDEYKALNAAVKKVGGYYSRFAKTPDGKAIPGFVFKSKPDADVINTFNGFFGTETAEETAPSETKSTVKEIDTEALLGAVGNAKVGDEIKLSDYEKTEADEQGLNNEPESDTIVSEKTKEDFKVGDILEFDGEQWKCVSIDTMMIDFVNVNKDAFQREMSAILPYELFKEKTDYKVVKKQGEDAWQPEVDKKPAENKKATPAIEQQTDISKKAVNDVAEFVMGELARGAKITSNVLFDVAKTAYGGSMADGVFTPKDAYDAMELGVNKYILSLPNVSTPRMLDILKLLPAQTKRTEEMIKYQQFSTPPSIAYLANYVANINSKDIMLEPSAGIGGIAVFAKRDGATVYVNELDPRRLAIVKELPFDGFYNENAEQIDNILGREIQPSVIVMNPPFSSSSERNIKGTKIGAKHIEQALQILAPGGRLVAIVGHGMAPDAPAFQQWWKDISAKYNVRANIGINGKNYNKYGTNFDIQMLVIDKDGGPTILTEVGTVDTLQELEKKLGGIRNERPSFNYSKLERPTTGTVEPKASEISEAGDQRRPTLSGTSGTASIRQSADGAVSSGEPKREEIPKTSSKPGSTSDSRPAVTDTTTNESGFNGRGESGRSIELHNSDRAFNDAGRQSDLQPGLQGSDGNSGNGRTPSRVSRLKHTELTDSIFEQYQTAPFPVEGAKQHPAKVSESAAMSAIEAPPITYKPALPQKVIADGVVSDVQIESISRAGQSHSQILPSGTRRGFFIGDGTGMGKGRTIAGIILDNYNQGRKKAVWITLNSSLVNDAKRDVKAVFGSSDLVTQFVGGNKADQIMDRDEGILVVSYSSLSRAFDSAGSNFEKIVKWLGKDFDGVIVFDEAHKMGNSSDTKGSRGVKKASQTGLSGIAFQNALPQARVVYSSATGATEVENLRYAERLGLWGDGTAFASGDDFVSKIKAGGLAAMELVARDLKAMGVYLSRNISYDGIEYDKIEHTLTPQQEQIYNELARSWQVVLQNINKALETTNQNKNGNARGHALGAFWSSQQRFFNQILTSMQAPSVIADIEKQLSAGKSCVIQLVSTNESAQNEEFARIQTEDLTLDDFDLTPKQMLMSFIENSFPVQQYEDYVDDQGNKRSKPVLDSKGKPVLNREAVRQRDELLAKLGSIKVPSSPIDMIISHFGTDMVAENTGRQRRVIAKDGKMVEEKIGSKKDADVDAFQNGKKRIIIFSKAGGTGKSYHADKSAKNQQQRVHYVYEPGWQADNAVQGFGRTNRSNQAVPPIYKLVTTNLKGQMRFISTIAKRLDQLGAMTKGQRQAGSTGLFSSEDNLESVLASDVLAVFYKDLARNNVDGIDNGLAIIEKLGLKDKIIDEYGSVIATAPELREVNKFLNRILTLETHEQNAVFDCYSNRLQEATEIAKQNGTLDKGLENYKADKISLNEEKDIREDKNTGATTKYYSLTAEHKLHPTAFADIETSRSNFVGYYQHRTNQAVRAVFKTSSTTDQYGNVHDNYKFVGPGRCDYAPELRLYSNWEKIEEADAKKLWNAELAMLPEYRKENLHLIGGVVLPVWDKLPDENVRIYRVLTDKGDMLIGRVVPEDKIDETLRKLGSSRAKEAVPTKDIIAGIKSGDTVYLDNGWRIVQRKVSNENRIEIIGPEYFNYDKLKSKGVFSERISYNTRYFIPIGDNAVSVFDEVLKISPVLRIESTRLALGGINDERNSSTSESEERRDFQPALRKGKPIFTDRKGNLGGLGRKKYCEALRADEVEYKTINGAIRAHFVKEHAYNDDIKNIVSDLRRQGYKKIGFYVGDAHLLYNPGARGSAISFGENGVFDEIYIRYDDPDYSPRQLGLHEVGHKIYNTPHGQKISNIIKNSMSFTERAKVLSSERYQRYMATLEDGELVFEEFVCDILGGMTNYADMFEDIATAFRNNDEAFIDNYKVSEYNKLIDTGDHNASVLENVGLGNDYKLSESGELDGYGKENTSEELGWNRNIRSDKTPAGVDKVGHLQQKTSDTPHTKGVHRSGVSAEVVTSSGLTAEQAQLKAQNKIEGVDTEYFVKAKTESGSKDATFNTENTAYYPDRVFERNGIVIKNGIASFTEKRYNDLVEEFSVPVGGKLNQNYSKGYVAYISPSDFLSLTTNNEKAIIEQTQTKPDKYGNGKLDIDRLSSTQQTPFLTIDFDDGVVCGHEGRHRMVMLRDAGIAKVAIVVKDINSEESKYKTEKIQNVSVTGQVLNGKKASGNVTFDEIIPLSPAYRDEVVEKFVNKPTDIKYALSTYDSDSESLTLERKKQIFEQFEKDRAGMPKQTQKEIWGERAAWVANNMTRTFPEIPERGEKGVFFAEFRKNMIQWKNLATTASFMVQDKLNKMTDGLTPEEFKTFSELVYFLDLQEEAQIQFERGYSEILLPNEITTGEVDEIVKVLNEEATENVRQALIKRQNIWDELKDQYIALNQYIGFDTDDKFKRKNYYHHQIIEYMNSKDAGTASHEIGIKAGRGWLKERKGSTKAINTDFLAVEYKAMLQMQYDVYIANMLGKIKKQYDIKPQLEQQAFTSNKQLLNEIIAKEATGKDGNILYDQKGQPDSETYRQQLWYNQRIMFGFNGLFDLAERNALPTFDGEYAAVVNALKMHNLDVAGLYRYVGVLANAELPENATETQEQALTNSRTVLKYTAKKKAWIKELLGDRYQTWETLAREMGDTHVIHQPRRGNYFYTKTIIDEDAFNMAFNEMIFRLSSGDCSLEPSDDVKKLFEQYADTVRLIGVAYEQWVLPKEIVSTMDSVANPKQVHSMAQAARGVVSAWKGWATSVNPLRTVKFGLRNLYGDLDAVIAGKPQVVKYSKRAVEEIYQAMRHKKYTPEFMEWVERGGYTSMIFANEMDAEMQDKLFAHLKDKTGKGVFDTLANIFTGYYDGVKAVHDFREAILRYSAYLYFKEAINQNGGVVSDYVASNRYIVKGLQSIEDKAYQLSKDLLGAYDEVGMMGQTLRRYWIPFYSFTETNLKRYYRMFENIIVSNDDIPKKVGKLLLKALMVNMLGLLTTAWNKLVMKDVDDQLPPSVRTVPHLTLGKFGNNIYAFRQLGSFSEILEWIGLDDYKWTREDFTAPLDKAWGMITPFVKLPVELASGLNFYPSLTEPRAIRDKWQHFFSSLGVDGIYSELAGKPTRGVGEILKSAFVYNYDYQESAYYEILDIKRNYQGSNDNTIYGTDAKSNALYYMKTAIRYKDKKAALKYLDEYFENGGTGKGIKQSFATLNPMYGYTGKDTIEKGEAFIASLTDDEKEKLKIAQNFYEKELMLPESVSSRLGKKDITDEEAKNLLRNYINSQCK